MLGFLCWLLGNIIWWVGLIYIIIWYFFNVFNFYSTSYKNLRSRNIIIYPDIIMYASSKGGYN
jgi:hypothetical protein